MKFIFSPCFFQIQTKTHQGHNYMDYSQVRKVIDVPLRNKNKVEKKNNPAHRQQSWN